MKLLHYVLLINIVWLNYSSVVQGQENTNSSHVPRVWNGKPAKLGQFPYQVGLMMRTRRKGSYAAFCGGAIIGRSKVLTAAHCLVPDDERSALDKCACKTKPVASEKHIKSIRIIAGNIRTIFRFNRTVRTNSTSRTNRTKANNGTKRTFQWRTIESYKHPDDYNFPEQDICVITTNKPWRFDKIVGSLPYASKHIDYGNKICTASGFGLLNKDTKRPKYSTTMMWENFKLMSQAACKKQHKSEMKDFICTDSKTKDVTPGDSGGPLVCKNTGDPREKDKGIIVGVVCGASKYGNFYTRVSPYTKLVDSAEKIACPQFCVFIALTLFLLNS